MVIPVLGAGFIGQRPSATAARDKVEDLVRVSSDQRCDFGPKIYHGAARSDAVYVTAGRVTEMDSRNGRIASTTSGSCGVVAL